MGGPLVLVGPAGRGKTSLAAKLAHDDDLRQHYPDGILWCDLLHADLTTVLLQLADVLGFEPETSPIQAHLPVRSPNGSRRGVTY